MTGLDMWWKDDIGNVLLGIDMCSVHMATGRNEAERSAYQDGFHAALQAVAASLGISQQSVSHVRIIDQSPRQLTPRASSGGYS